jgi:hypothetical protein
LQNYSNFNEFYNYKVFGFLFIIGKAGKNRLRKAVILQFEAVFEVSYKIPSTVL